VELVIKNTSLYVQQCCGKRLYILTFYMFNKRVHLLVKRILMLSKCTVRQLQ